MSMLEKVHGNFGKLIQGLSPHVSTPARYCILGWRPIEAVFDISKLTYVLRLLSLPCWSLYNRIAIARLTDCRFRRTMEKGPIAQIYTVVRKYEICDTVHNMLDLGSIPTKMTWRKTVLRAVSNRYNQIWRMSSMMYRTMDYVLRIHDDPEKRTVWWTVCRVNPRVTRLCKLVVRLLCGDHNLNTGRGRFTLNTARCCICDSYEQETLEHTLYTCDALRQVRDLKWDAVLDAMPAGMRHSVIHMNANCKTYYVISGCHSTYIEEWQDIYETMARFVWAVYYTRERVVGALAPTETFG